MLNETIPENEETNANQKSLEPILCRKLRQTSESYRFDKNISIEIN